MAETERENQNVQQCTVCLYAKFIFAITHRVSVYLYAQWYCLWFNMSAVFLFLNIHFLPLPYSLVRSLVHLFVRLQIRSGYTESV